MKSRKYWVIEPILYFYCAAMLIMMVATLIASKSFPLKMLHIMISLVVTAVTLVVSTIAKGNIQTYITEVSQSFDTSNKEAIDNIPVPAVFLSFQGEIVLYNELFREDILLGADAQGVNLSRVFKGFDVKYLESESEFVIKKEKKFYNVSIGQLEIDAASQYVLYFNDITELKKAENNYKSSRPSVILVAFDNEEELLKLRENERVRVISAVESLLGKWVEDCNCISKIDARDRSFIIIEEQYIQKIISSRFSVLAEARKIIIEGGNSATFSIGVGRGGANFSECEYWANQALEMAFGRGGDQAVVKDAEGYSFYGGVSKSVEKQSKVRTRMLAQALMDLIKNNDDCFVMGHRFSDLDAIGAAIGMASIVSSLQKHTEKTVNIVVDEKSSLADSLIKSYRETKGVDWFISPDEALDKMNNGNKSLLIIVDTHSPEVVESAAVCNAANEIAIIDHHRMTVKRIENSTIFFHEPYASSTCEMVTELAPYMDESAITRPEAEALLSGIMLDTKSFVLRTGARTFEAAAYLRRKGAETMEVKRFFSGSLQTYTEKSQLVSSAKLYGDCAISCTDRDNIEDIRVIASQAADEMLNISSVYASFVIFTTENEVNISARSFGKINVQLIMEKLGGGGHMTMAAAQLGQIPMNEAREKLIAAIDEFREELSQE